MTVASTEFEYERSRGIAWVCDVANSSNYLNSQTTVDDIELFLPRLLWISEGLVEAFDGVFVKWTGDGFLAWFSTPLHRDIPKRVSQVFRAAQYLTMLVNVTQLALTPERKFRIRHGVTIEHDALIVRYSRPGGFRGMDLIGRAVTLAFRLSGLDVPYPAISTQAELAKALNGSGIRFKKRTFSKDELLKYFKGERWGTGSVYVSCDRKPRPRSRSSVIRQAKHAIANAEGPDPVAKDPFFEAFVDYTLGGPPWARQVMDEFSRFVNEDLLGSLKRILEHLPPTQEAH